MESRERFSRYAYAAVAWLFVAGILMQVFLIGLTFLGGRPSLQTHAGLGHGLAIAPLLMVVLAYTGRLPSPMKPFTWLALVVYVLLADVVIFLRGSAPIIAALHPVLAVLLFGVAGFLAVRAWRLVREVRTAVLVKSPAV
ncbi:MAG: hypothetical protein HZC41_20665 [Chloroflexi bacterium]|nr:hypothetical protein [Chloroflexota bacterium]